MIVLALLMAAQTAPVVQGEKIFNQSCAVGYCHGTGGAASRGPRLRGRTFARDYLVKVTSDGVPNTAMPAWKGRLGEVEIQAVTDYIMSLANATGEASGSQPVQEPVVLRGADGPAGVELGRELFFDPVRQNRCSACHRIAGVGVAVGPDLTKRRPQKLSTVLRNTKSRSVSVVKLKDGETLTGVIAERTTQAVRIFDMTAAPPVLRSFSPGDVVTITLARQWAHAGALKDYKGNELEAISKYLNWMAAGKK